MDNTDDTPLKVGALQAEAVWEKALSLQSTWQRALRLSSFVVGLTPWLPADRLARVERTRVARFLREAVTGLTPTARRCLETRARINRDLAGSAFRLVVVGNVTIPVAVVAIVNGLTDGRVYSATTELFEPGIELLALVVAVLASIGAIVLYAYAAAANARDLHHLVQLYGASGADVAAAEADDGMPDFAD